MRDALLPRPWYWEAKSHKTLDTSLNLQQFARLN